MTKKKKLKFRLSSSGAWVKGSGDYWTLQEDQRFSVYRGQTEATKNQWFLVQRERIGLLTFYSQEVPLITPWFLGKARNITEALDFADVEIAQRRFNETQKENV